MELPIWQRAAAFAARAHDGQLRKDGATPYISHPFRVAITVRHIFGCEDAEAITIALLHDTIEDTRTDYDDLHRQFGPRIADAVAALSKNKMLAEPVREPEYDARIAQADWRVRLVKLADQYDNLSDSLANRGIGSTPAAHKRAENARRAVELARRDAAQHPPIARAIEELERLIAWSTQQPQAG